MRAHIDRIRGGLVELLNSNDAPVGGEKKRSAGRKRSLGFEKVREDIVLDPRDGHAIAD